MIRQTPYTWNATVYAGATFDQTWLVSSDAGGTAAVDLTGCTGTASCRTAYSAGSAVVSFGTANLILGGTAGTLRFKLDAATTTALGSALAYEPTQLLFDCEITESSGDVSRVLQGVWSVLPEVTR